MSGFIPVLRQLVSPIYIKIIKRKQNKISYVYFTYTYISFLHVPTYVTVPTIVVMVYTGAIHYLLRTPMSTWRNEPDFDEITTLHFI
jgi:hypothetical protein